MNHFFCPRTNSGASDCSRSLALQDGSWEFSGDLEQPSQLGQNPWANPVCLTLQKASLSLSLSLGLRRCRRRHSSVNRTRSFGSISNQFCFCLPASLTDVAPLGPSAAFRPSRKLPHSRQRGRDELNLPSRRAGSNHRLCGIEEVNAAGADRRLVFDFEREGREAGGPRRQSH